MIIDKLVDIIATELALNPARVNIYNQKFKIPTDDGIFVSVAFLGSKAYRATTKTQDDGEAPTVDFQEYKEINTQEMYSIKIMSRSTDALSRKEEILGALVSQYAQGVMEANGFKIARLPTNFIDISEVEASARLYAFAITVVVLAAYKINKQVPYYDNFDGQISNEQITQVQFEQDVP